MFYAFVLCFYLVKLRVVNKPSHISNLDNESLTINLTVLACYLRLQDDSIFLRCKIGRGIGVVRMYSTYENVEKAEDSSKYLN